MGGEAKILRRGTKLDQGLDALKRRGGLELPYKLWLYQFTQIQELLQELLHKSELSTKIMRCS